MPTRLSRCLNIRTIKAALYSAKLVPQRLGGDHFGPPPAESASKGPPPFGGYRAATATIVIGLAAFGQLDPKSTECGGESYLHADQKGLSACIEFSHEKPDAQFQEILRSYITSMEKKPAFWGDEQTQLLCSAFESSNLTDKDYIDSQSIHDLLIPDGFTPQQKAFVRKILELNSWMISKIANNEMRDREKEHKRIVEEQKAAIELSKIPTSTEERHGKRSSERSTLFTPDGPGNEFFDGKGFQERLKDTRSRHKERDSWETTPDGTPMDEVPATASYAQRGQKRPFETTPDPAATERLLNLAQMSRIIPDDPASQAKMRDTLQEAISGLARTGGADIVQAALDSFKEESSKKSTAIKEKIAGAGLAGLKASFPPVKAIEDLQKIADHGTLPFGLSPDPIPSVYNPVNFKSVVINQHTVSTFGSAGGFFLALVKFLMAHAVSNSKGEGEKLIELSTAFDYISWLNLQSTHESLNLWFALACDTHRRKELAEKISREECTREEYSAVLTRDLSDPEVRSITALAAAIREKVVGKKSGNENAGKWNTWTPHFEKNEWKGKGWKGEWKGTSSKDWHSASKGAQKNEWKGKGWKGDWKGTSNKDWPSASNDWKGKGTNDPTEQVLRDPKGD